MHPFNTTFPGVLIAFLANGGILQPRVWSDWAEAADQWILDTLHLSPRHVLQGTIHDQTSLLRNDASLPPNLSHSLSPTSHSLLSSWVRTIQDPAECRWGRLNSCQYRLFQRALQQFPQARWIALVSGSSIPIARFQDMYTLLNANKTYVRIEVPNFYSNCPKVSQWAVYRRDHLEWLIRNPEKWVSQPWVHNKTVLPARTLKAAPDEFWPICALKKAISPATHHPLPSTQFQWAPSTASSSTSSYNLFQHADCWRGCNHFGSVLSNKRPASYLDLSPSRLQDLLQLPYSWFLRKVTANTTVHGQPLHRYLKVYW